LNGILYLIPTSLGDDNYSKIFPPLNKEIINTLDHFIVEEIRTARRFLSSYKIVKPIQELIFFELNKFTKLEELDAMFDPLKRGIHTGLMSEAGLPGIADPGAVVVQLAHKNNIQVIPLIGPSSIFITLMSSGLSGQNFAFNGYLPIQPLERISRIKQLEARSKQEQQSQIFMETPFRNQKMLEDILKTCNNDTLLCIGADITLPTEFIKTQSIQEWKKTVPQINKRPAIFIIQKF
jgi:16S rRNA (cytidine1402-2'-O)-methyltransferase